MFKTIPALAVHWLGFFTTLHIGRLGAEIITAQSIKLISLLKPRPQSQVGTPTVWVPQVTQSIFAPFLAHSMQGFGHSKIIIK